MILCCGHEGDYNKITLIGIGEVSGQLDGQQGAGIAPRLHVRVDSPRQRDARTHKRTHHKPEAPVSDG